MPGIVERITQTKSLLESAASLAVLLLQYVALSNLVTLPSTASELARIISLVLTITVTLVIFVLSGVVSRLSGKRIALIALLTAAAGVALAFNYSSYAGRFVVSEPESCSAGTPQVFVVPASPPAEIVGILDIHGDYETALCDVQDQGRFRRLIERENDRQTTGLVLRLVFSQLLLVTGILLIAWKLILDGRRDGAATAGDAAKGANPAGPPAG